MILKYFTVIYIALTLSNFNSYGAAARAPSPDKAYFPAVDIHFFPAELERQFPAAILDKNTIDGHTQVFNAGDLMYTIILKLKPHGQIIDIRADGSNRREANLDPAIPYPTLRQIIPLLPADPTILKPFRSLDIDMYNINFVLRRTPTGDWIKIDPATLRIGDIFTAVQIGFKRTIRIEAPRVLPPELSPRAYKDLYGIPRKK